MKTLALLIAVSISLFAPESFADRFPGGEPGDECRAGVPDAEDCGEGMSCGVVDYEIDPDRPGYIYPIYNCVEDSERELSLSPNQFYKRNF